MSTPSTTTPKLIPFDLNIALKHPERVRHKDGRKAINIAHFPTANHDFRIFVQWNIKEIPNAYTEDGHNCQMSGGVSSLFLTAETKHIPWTTIDEVPEGVYFRQKGLADCFICTGYTTTDTAYIIIDATWLPLAELFHNWEYSPNRNGPWLPCGKEVEV